ncbi:MAG: hypothetical protein ABSE72_03390 [Bacteroidales bacterium]|jgi:photosystem II stability/assembly factor-like uncharacterized protein
MKRYSPLFSLVMIIVCIVVSCSKNDNNPQSVERKPYAWVAGAMDSTGYGMILYSADSGETWERQGLGNDALKDVDVSDIWAVDENTIWAVCSGNVILRSLDGGKTWIRLQLPENKTSTLLSAISIVNKNNIWISGSGGTVYNSFDNGNTWRRYDTTIFREGLMQGIWAINSQNVYVAGKSGDIPGESRGYIGYTKDGGATWDTVFPADDYNRHEWIGVAASGHTIVVYGGKAHYMFSTDGGLTWSNDSILHTGGVLGADINHLVMLNPQTWWGALDLSQIFLTTNGGSAWVSQPAVSNGEFNVGIDAFNSQLAIVVGTLPGWPKKGSIQKTTDGGLTWKNIHTYRSFLNKVTFIKP